MPTEHENSMFKPRWTCAEHPCNTGKKVRSVSQEILILQACQMFTRYLELVLLNHVIDQVLFDLAKHARHGYVCFTSPWNTDGKWYANLRITVYTIAKKAVHRSVGKVGVKIKKISIRKKEQKTPKSAQTRHNIPQIA